MFRVSLASTNIVRICCAVPEMKHADRSVQPSYYACKECTEKLLDRREIIICHNSNQCENISMKYMYLGSLRRDINNATSTLSLYHTFYHNLTHIDHCPHVHGK
jgi:hypothetical protein